MKQVWKCDYCSHTDPHPDVIEKHEKGCSFNKVNKKCYTCKFSREDVMRNIITGCDINEDTLRGEEEENCPGWVYEYLDRERDDKLKQIGI
jgi:hypothetical protein